MRRIKTLAPVTLLLGTALALGAAVGLRATPADGAAGEKVKVGRFNYLRVDKLSLPESGTPSAVDIRLDGTGKALRVFARGSESAGTYLNDSGMLYTSGWIVVSGTATGQGEDLSIQHASKDPTMISVWSDVGGPAVQLRAANANGAYILSGLDRAGNYTFSVEEDGRLRWGSGTRPAMDANLYRTAPGSLRTDGAFAVSSRLSAGAAGPKSTLHVGGSQSVRRTAVEGDYDVTDQDYYVGVVNTDARRTVTLPSAQGREGRVYVIKDETGKADRQPIRVRAAGGQTIDGAPGVEIDSAYGGVRLISNGQNWFRM